jgi:membrane protease subunit (stomatin/prohibitin family)
MARKVKGYVELYWRCPSCGSENLGSHAYCTSCGLPQPKNVSFHQGSKQELLTDSEKIKRAKAGADIHCGFCGTRNPAAAAKCAQCGADLKAGSRRTAGQMVGAFSQGAVEPIQCANCGTMNAGTRLKCGNCGSSLSHGAPAKEEREPVAAKPANSTFLLIGGAVILGICALIYFLFIRTQQVSGIVNGVSWQRSIAVEAFEPVRLEAWQDEVPFDASQVSCSEQVRNVQDQPPASGRYDEVCGTAYTVDLGNGNAEVVQDCEYQIYDDYCSYVAEAWVPVSTVEAAGFDLNAVSPNPVLASNQRLGETNADYVCTFDSNGKTYSYHTTLFEEFQRCAIGSAWLLSVNGAGAVTEITPAN